MTQYNNDASQALLHQQKKTIAMTLTVVMACKQTDNTYYKNSSNNNDREYNNNYKYKQTTAIKTKQTKQTKQDKQTLQTVQNNTMNFNKEPKQASKRISERRNNMRTTNTSYQQTTNQQ